MPGVMHVQAVVDDTESPSADTAIMTFDYELPVTPPGVNDWGAFETAFATFWDAIDGHIHTNYRCVERRYYNVPGGANPTLGDPVHVATSSFDGAQSTDTPMPPQMAIAVTELTAVRRRWGRFYVPGWTVAAVDGGRVLAAVRTALAQGAHDMYEAMATTGREMVVRRRADGSYQLVHSVQVDDVWDVVRRRRFSVTFARSLHSISD
jgi:hypothetical protein